MAFSGTDFHELKAGAAGPRWESLGERLRAEWHVVVERLVGAFQAKSLRRGAVTGTVCLLPASAIIEKAARIEP